MSAGRRIPRARLGRATGIKIRLAEEEKQRLAEKAREHGVSISRLLVDPALELPLPGPAVPAVGGMTLGEGYELGASLDRARLPLGACGAQLVRLGNNLNQLAHVANVSGDTPAVVRLEETLDGVETTLEEIRAALREIQPLLLKFPAHP